MATLHKAAIDTSNFSFEAYGATQEEAREALRAGLTKHSEHYRVSDGPEWVEECMEDVRTLEITLGTCYRDGEPVLLSTPAKPKG